MTKEKKATKQVFYITTAIDYPNANPHVGHAFEKIIADAYARWYRCNEYDTFFITGTDENSQKIVQAAEQEKKPVELFLNEKVNIFKEFCKKLNISNDDFIRTTEERHKKIAQLLFEKVRKKGDIYKGVYKGQYCVPCESFWTDTQLVKGKCPQCKRETKPAEEETYFFQMSKYQAEIIEHIEEDHDFIVPETRRNEILARLKEPLRDLCVSRSSLKWGIKLPHDEQHVIYVWFDALINYISALDYPNQKYETYWKDAVHVIGKDIIWFHCVIWPCILIACDIPLPKQILVHGFINDKHGEKMSKSRGNVVDPFLIISKYGVDALRYYLLRAVPQGEDGKFDEEELLQRYNNELANDLGNLIKRITTLTAQIGGGIQNERFDNALHPEHYMALLQDLMERREHHKAIEELWNFIKKINAYLNEQEPWKVKDEKKKKEILYNTLESIRFGTHYLHSFMPNCCEKIAFTLGFKLQQIPDLKFGEGAFSMHEAEMLFPKLERKEENIFHLNLKVAKIIDVKIHPEADKLYILQLDIGTEKKQIVSGIRDHYKEQELLNRNIILVSNLKKAKLRGVESEGMLLAAGENARLLSAPKSKPGDQVFIDMLQKLHRSDMKIS